jgi:hypothetical protein
LASAAPAQVWWPQWALNPQHTGQVDLAGQSMNNILTSIVYDPLVPAELAANQGSLLAHYQVPLIQVSLTGDSNIYMELKSGSYNKNTYSTEIWGRTDFSGMTGNWSRSGVLPAIGRRPDRALLIYPFSKATSGNRCSIAVLANGFIYVPGAGGTLFKLDTRTGAVVSRINPFSGKLRSMKVRAVRRSNRPCRKPPRRSSRTATATGG